MIDDQGEDEIGSRNLVVRSSVGLGRLVVLAEVVCDLCFEPLTPKRVSTSSFRVHSFSLGKVTEDSLHLRWTPAGIELENMSTTFLRQVFHEKESSQSYIVNNVFSANAEGCRGYFRSQWEKCCGVNRSNHYVVMIVSGVARYSWVYLLKISDNSEMFEQFPIDVNNYWKVDDTGHGSNR